MMVIVEELLEELLVLVQFEATEDKEELVEEGITEIKKPQTMQRSPAKVRRQNRGRGRGVSIRRNPRV